MIWQHTPYTLPLLGAAAVSVALAFYVWRRRFAPGVLPFMGVLLAVAVWSLGYALELASANLPAKLFWARFQYVGIVTVPGAGLAFALQYTGRARWLTRRNLFLLAFPSLVMLFLVYTNNLHHLIWASVGLDTSGAFSLLALSYGAVFWGIVVYIYAALLLGSALLFQVLFRGPRLYRGQIIAVLLGVLAPWVGNILYISGLDPFPHLDLTPFAFTFTSLAVVWGLFRFRLLDIVPVARGAVLDNMDDAVIVLDLQGRIVDINPAAERLIASPPAQVIGQPAASALSTRPALAQWGSEVTDAHQELVLGEGESLRICDASRSTLRERRGLAIGRLLVLRDITDRRRAEQAIRDSELKYHTLFETSTDAIFLETLDGRVLDCNAAACQMFGYTKEELLALSVVDLVPEDVAKTLPDVISEELMTGGVFFEAANKRKDGRIIPVEVSTRLIDIGLEQLALVCVRDISARQQLEQQSKERRLYLESVLACAPDAIVTLDAQQRVLDWNQGAEELFGYTRDEVRGQGLDGLVSGSEPKTLEEATRLTRQVLAGTPVLPTETVRYAKDGSSLDVIVAGSPILVQGQPAGLVAIYTNIAERKRSEKAIRESEEKYRTLVERSLQGIVIAQGVPPRFIFANAAMADIVGYTVEELLSLGPDQVTARIHPEDQAAFFKRYRERLSGEPLLPRYEVRLVQKDGTPRWVEMFVSTIEVGGRPAVQAAFVDITERKQAEQELRAGEERYRSLYSMVRLMCDNVPDMIWAKDMEGRFIFANQAICDKLLEARDTGEPIGKTEMFFAERERAAHPEDPHWYTFGEICSESDRAVLSSRQAQRFDESGHIRGEFLFLDVYKAPFWNEQEEMIGTVGCARIVTREKEVERQRQQAQEALHRRNRELALLNRVIAASAASQEIVPILETVCRELAETFDIPHAAASLLNAEKTKAVMVAEYRADDRVSLLGHTIETTDLSVAQYLFQHKIPLLVDDARADPRLGPICDMIPPGSPLSLLFLPILIEGEMVGGLGMAADGPRSFTPAEVDLACRVAEQVSGALTRARLAETERRLSAAVDQAAEAVVVLDADATILYANPAFEQIVGYTRAEVIGQLPTILGSGKLDLFFHKAMWQAVTGGQVWQERIEYARRDGRLCYLDMTTAPVRDQAAEIVSYVTTMRDVTREIQLEAEFQQAQKMEALGRLAGGVAHDINNLLAVIQISAQLLERRLHADDPLREHVGPIRETVDRAAKLTGQLLRFSRGGVIKPRVLDLNQVVGDMSDMVQRIIGEDIRLVTRLADDLWPIQADPTQIDQVIANLAVNARDAMPGGGALTIETANVILDKAYAELHVDARPGEYVLLTVSDTGVGMDDGVKARIFEPFFSTKEPGQGTGLGLATVFGIVVQGGGRIDVSSEVARGTTFRIYWPRSQEAQLWPEALSPALPSITSSLSRGTETVLLVEDDAPVRELAERILQSCGYRVLVAGDGLQALQVTERHDGPIHLLLSDVVMPYMRGSELAAQLLPLRPEMRVLYMSGYTDGAIAEQGVLPPDTFFLAKPFTIEGLTETVRHVLDGTP